MFTGKENGMSDDLARRMARVMTEIVAPGNGGYIRRDHVEMAQAIIEDLGLEPTDASRYNAMVRYETRWMDRSN